MQDRTDGPGRVAWIDIAKALAILLVVVFHISVWFSYSVVPVAAGGSEISFWREISNALIPVRIPLFFLVSGVLAHRAVTRTWAELARTRFAGLLWPFALWTALIALPWSLRVDHADPSANFGTAGAAVVFAGAHFWYLPALVLFLALAKAVRPHPVIALLAAVIVSVVIAPLLSPVYGLLGPVLGVNLERWLHFALWFLAGCFFPLVVRRAAEWNAMLVPVGIAGLIAGRWLLINVSSHPAVTLAIGAVGVVTLVILSRWVARWGVVRRMGGYLARRTLPIYVVHAFALELLAVGLAFATRRGWGLPSENPLVNVFFVPAVFLAVVGASLGVDALARRWNARWLFEAPALLTRRATARSR